MLSQKQIELVEKIGIYFEQGMQPASARILALLIVSDHESFSFDEIREILNLSKSATSNAINFLLSVKKIEYYTKSGERKRYFKWSPVNTINHFKEGIEKVLGLSILFEETLKLKKDKYSFNTQRLEELTDLMNFLHEELPGVYHKWEQGKSKTKIQ
ncbi:MAG: MarR family transcriptional regulator [Cytophagales bacterium]|nr:MarR family transcriptional regulator [Cytophagales bacterium]